MFVFCDIYPSSSLSASSTSRSSSPWNTNPSAYVSRSPTVAGTSATFGGELPSCQASAWCYASSTMAEMNGVEE